MTGKPDRREFGIVLSYRRDDSAGHAGRLYDALTREFGEDRVFMDIDAIDPGVDFFDVIEQAIGSCDAFVSVIGRDWLEAKDVHGRRRLADPNDYVRREIETALAHGARVIPVLVQDAEMPVAEDLPPAIAPLARRNAVELRDTSWRPDVDRFVRKLREELEGEDGRRVAAEARRLPRRLLVVGAVVATLAAAAVAAALLNRGGAPDSSPESPGSGGGLAEEERIAVDAGGRIYVAPPDASGVTLLRGAGFARAPDWSPDGLRLAISRSGDIWAVDPDGGRERRLTSGPAIDGGPAWSPDGKRIAFDRHDPGHPADIWVVRSDGKGARVLIAGAAAPAWSPDGGRIAFQRRYHVWVADLARGETRRLDEHLPGTHLFPAWSPDGSRIAFVTTGVRRCEIVLVRPDGSAPTMLQPSAPSRCSDVAWSPDARRLAFVGDGAVWTIRRDGSDATRLGDAPGVRNPSWSRRA